MFKKKIKPLPENSEDFLVKTAPGPSINSDSVTYTVTFPKNKKRRTMSTSKNYINTAREDYSSYIHKYGHIFIKLLTLIIRTIGAILWCNYYINCPLSITWSLTHLALTGLLPTDTIVLTEFIFKRSKPYYITLTHDLFGLSIGVFACGTLAYISECSFQDKMANFIPTSILLCTLLHLFHVIMFFMTYKE